MSTLSSNLTLTSIEEIVRYQQELLNYQRNQKQLQKETIKLLNALNKSLTFMSDRLDEFAFKTNTKLDDHVQPVTINLPLSNNILSSSTSALNSSNPGIPFQIQTAVPLKAITNANNQSVNHANSNNLIYLNNDFINNKDNNNMIILGDFGTNLMQSPAFVLNLDNNPNVLSNTSTTGSTKPIIKLNEANFNILDTTNSNNQNISGNKLNSSDDSLGDISYEETTDEEKETIQNKKKHKNNSNTNNSNSSQNNLKTKDTEENNNQQRLFNKFVRESVERRLGKEFLLLHEIQEIDQDIMEQIKNEALETYPPSIRPRRAWHLAKASLRCRRRSLRRQKERLILSSSTNPSPSTSTLTNSLASSALGAALLSASTVETQNINNLANVNHQ